MYHLGNIRIAYYNRRYTLMIMTVIIPISEPKKKNTKRTRPTNVFLKKNDSRHMTLDITSAWINKLHAVHPRFRSESIYQGPHEHMGWGTGISGVYYAAMGWSARNGSGAEDGRFVPPTFEKKSTKFNVMKPIRFAGLDSGSNVSPFESIDPTPGTLLLFPSCK